MRERVIGSQFPEPNLRRTNLILALFSTEQKNKFTEARKDIEMEHQILK